ncbi:PTS sugar transporter subunit IIA [Niallia circulans]|uniref:PTS sugar transporter subunit IIA n=1 Tax=Niallia circulans TaxID=1397 RepID=UPI00163B616A|nr:PTS sugar transporter subunit IIA [Niallia circulans]
MLLNDSQIFLDLELNDRDAVLEYISVQAQQLGIIENQEVLLKDFISREEQYPTAFQEGIAIPHAKSVTVKKATLFFIKTKEKIDWKSPDHYKVKFIFAILVPEMEAGTKHIKILSALAGNLMEEQFQERLFKVNTKEDILNLFKSVEMEVV